MQKKLSIILLEPKKLGLLPSQINSISNELTACKLDWEIIVIVDNLETINNFKSNIGQKNAVYDYPSSMPMANKLAYALSKSQGELICFIENDLEMPALNIRTALAYIEQDSAEIILGSSVHKQSRPALPASQHLIAFCNQFILRILFNLNIKEEQFKIKLFRRKILETILPLLAAKKAGSDLELLVAAKYFDFHKISQVPIISYQQSKASIPSPVKTIRQAFAVFANLAFHNYQKPIVLPKLLIRSSQFVQ